MKNTILAIDLGTTQIKLLVLNSDLQIVDTAVCKYPTYFPNPGWIEQYPEDWITALKRCINNLQTRNSLNGLSGISFSGHMSGVVLLDEYGNAIYPCITLADSRTNEQCNEIKHICGPLISEITGNPVINAFSLPKVLWLKENSENYNLCKVWISPKDYIRYRLTGVIGTEYTDAYNSLCVNRVTGNWVSEIPKSIGIDINIFPEIHKPFEIAGTISGEAAREFGLTKGIPVVYGAADMACGAVGNNLFQIGDSTLTLGTSATFLAMVSAPEKSEFSKVTYHMHVLPDKIYALGSHFNGGLAVNWITQLLSEKSELDFALTDKLANASELVPAGSNGVISIPFLVGSGSPYFNSTDQQVFYGITPSTSREVLFRSELEGVSYNLNETYEVIRKLAGDTLGSIILGGGGIKISVWPQILSDVFGRDLFIADTADASAVGAALIGAYAVGMLNDLALSSKKCLKIRKKVIPDAKNHKVYQQQYKKYLRLYSLMQGMKED